MELSEVARPVEGPGGGGNVSFRVGNEGYGKSELLDKEILVEGGGWKGGEDGG